MIAMLSFSTKLTDWAFEPISPSPASQSTGKAGEEEEEEQQQYNSNW